MLQKRLLLSLMRWTALLMATAAVSIGAGCQENDTGTAQAALTAVQGSVTTCEGLGAAVQQCLTARGTCLAAGSDAAAQAACAASFTSCLPADAARAGGEHGGHHGPGGKAHGGPGGKAGGDMANGCGPGSEVVEDACAGGSAVVLACQTALESCLGGGAAAAGCIETAKGCVATAVAERFQAMCEAQAATCGESDADPTICEQISTACKDGLAQPGGTVVSE